MPKEAGELANFYALGIDNTTGYESKNGFETGIRSFNEGCTGPVLSIIDIGADDTFHCKYDTCDNEGLISEWKGLKWDLGHCS